MAFCDAHDGEWILLPDMTDCRELLKVELQCGHFRFPTDLAKRVKHLQQRISQQLLFRALFMVSHRAVIGLVDMESDISSGQAKTESNVFGVLFPHSSVLRGKENTRYYTQSSHRCNINV